MCLYSSHQNCLRNRTSQSSPPDGYFDTTRINAVLEPHGFFYGAGYARSLKPTFFLARIEDKRNIDGFTVYTLGRELACDLLTIPALLQDESILLRRESGTFFLWDQWIMFTGDTGNLKKIHVRCDR